MHGDRQRHNCDREKVVATLGFYVAPGATQLQTHNKVDCAAVGLWDRRPRLVPGLGRETPEAAGKFLNLEDKNDDDAVMVVRDSRP